MLDLLAAPPTALKPLIWLVAGLPVLLGMEGWARFLH